MKKQVALKYPHSASLFNFCRRVLTHKYSGVRIIDQDVGHILAFDPADCSHWKKGKKNIYSIYAMKNIAKHLDVDEKLIVDLASGEIDDEEAFCEFLGYGKMELDPKTLDLAKKDFFKNHSTSWSRDLEQEFRNSFQVSENKINKLLTEIHQLINFQEAPLYLPEITSYYSDIVLEGLADFKGSGTEQIKYRYEKNKFIISYKLGFETRPYIRFRLAKAMAIYFLSHKSQTSDSKNYRNYIEDVEANIFAARLLVPTALIKKEIKNVDLSKDVLGQLAEIFWVSKSLINLRFKELIS